MLKGRIRNQTNFFRKSFAGDVPDARKLWFDKDMQNGIVDVLGHRLGVLRLSYWHRDDRTVWILEEIGKSLPITVGIVINENRVEQVKILIFRESRGWEVRYPFFTNQYTDSTLTDNHQLNRGIDGISGATLSVNAVNKLVILALLFHRQVTE